MKNIILIIIIHFSYLICQGFLYENFKPIPDDWEQSVEIDLDISKSDIYEGEDIVLFMNLKNISDTTLLIPLINVYPLIRNVHENKKVPFRFSGDRGYIILVPGEKATFTYTGFDFFPFHIQSSGLKGFPVGEYDFYSALKPDNKLQFKVKKVVDEKSLNMVRNMIKAKFDNELEKTERFQEINDQLNQIQDTVCKVVIINEYRFWQITRSIEEEEIKSNIIKTFINEFSEYASSIDIVRFLSRFNNPVNIYNDSFINEIKVNGLRNWLLWKKYMMDNAEWRLEEKKKIYDKYSIIKRRKTNK